MVTKSNEQEIKVVQQSIQQPVTDFSPMESMRAGIGAGAVLGIVVGGTVWTHMPDASHLAIALAILVFCMVVGAVIGRLVANIEPE